MDYKLIHTPKELLFSEEQVTRSLTLELTTKQLEQLLKLINKAHVANTEFADCVFNALQKHYN